MRVYRQVSQTPPAFRLTEVVTELELWALRAMEAGEATPDQQRLALRTIIVKLCATYDQAVVLGHPDQTQVRGGRQFVGQMLMKFLRADINLILGDKENVET